MQLSFLSFLLFQFVLKLSKAFIHIIRTRTISLVS